MMVPHLFGIAAATAFIVFCTLLPFLPGSYDSLAVPLSEMAHVVGTLGLLLVPVGLLWIAAQRSSRLVQRRHTFPLLALIASTLVWLGLCVAAIVHSGFVLGFAVLLLWGFVAVKAWATFRGRNAKATGLPFYLIAVPVLVALVHFVFVERAIEYSRNRAITNSASLIAAIEEYRTRNGRYPSSLLAEGTDHSPGVIGISQYHYEPHGDGYNLVFEQFNYNFGMREFVVYNPRDEHVMTAHAIDILQLTPAELVVERTRGHFARHDLPQPHWKRFWFD